MANQTKFCVHCGQQIAADAKFCRYCGARFDQPVQQPAYQQSVQQPVYQAPPQAQYQQPAYQQAPYQQPQYRQPVYQQAQYGQYAAGQTKPKRKKSLLKTAIIVLAVVVGFNVASELILAVTEPVVVYTQPTTGGNDGKTGGNGGGQTTTGNNGSGQTTGGNGSQTPPGGDGDGTEPGTDPAWPPVTPENGGTPSWMELNASENYPGPLYNYLSDGDKAIYDTLKNHFEGDGSLTDWVEYGSPLDGDSFQRAKFAYMNDNPYVGCINDYVEIHFMRNSGRFRVSDIRDYQADYQEMKPVVEQVVAGLSGTTSQKVKQINDFLMDKNIYQKESELRHTTHSAIVTGETVCQGYSSAFALLCKEAGIRCYLVWGNSVKRGGELGGNHSWDIVQLEDGNWYEIDVTWNDCGSDYDYFCISTTKMQQDHARSASLMCGFEDLVPVTQESALMTQRSAVAVLRTIAEAPNQFFDLFAPELPSGDMEDFGSAVIQEAS